MRAPRPELRRPGLPGLAAASGHSHSQEMPSEGCISLRAASVRLPDSDG